MSDVNDVLLELRDVGVRQLPEAGDAGERRVRHVLEQEMAHGRRRFGWARRRIAIGGFAFSPALALGVVAATAAAATGAAALTGATAVFQANPASQGIPKSIDGIPVSSPSLGSPDPSTVREVASADVPGYGTVRFWTASTTQNGGFCRALQQPDGAWAGYPKVTTSGVQIIPGCGQTRQQQILAMPAVQPGQQPNANSGQVLGLLPYEEWDGEIGNWDVYMGTVEVQGTAATVRDPATGATAPVSSAGYFLLVDPLGRNAVIGGAHLQVLDATGKVLKPDYTWGKMLPGYQPGPTPGPAGH